MKLCIDCRNGDCDSCYEWDCPCNLRGHKQQKGTNRPARGTGSGRKSGGKGNVSK